MVVGALCGAALDALTLRPVALVAALAVVAIALTAHYRLGFRRFVGALERFSPIFPTEHVIEPSS
ncbi:MAG TPA: hypothetical protein VFR38_03370 [Gaiellaceae bacterium]|nr:hypothetical protein [Gaiellaceae bacterium]